nr:reverse transcriptase N-terminal domain-containing protein [Bacillus toyonensis]
MCPLLLHLLTSIVSPWVRLEKYVGRLQQRIYRAENLGKKREVKNLKRLLMRSKAALLLLIR